MNNLYFLCYRSHSDCGSVRSNDSHRRPISGASKSIEQSDIESISLASQESRGSNEKDEKRFLSNGKYMFLILTTTLHYLRNRRVVP